MRVLIVEDSERLRNAVATGLRNSGYAVDAAGDGAAGLWHARATDYDVIVLDLTLPGIDGLTLLGRLRAAGRATHVLVLTARDTVAERVAGLRAGADDYLVKPFAFDELLARVEALVRRRHGAKNPRIEVGRLAVDTAARAVTVDGRAVDLSPREYALLAYLAARPGTVVSRAEIETHIYDERAGPASNVVDAAVYSLRKKIDPPGGPSYVRTRRGMGYAFQA
ncbi:MAG: DNA-binding response regulator, partial [Phycisphaerales bacterium]|nr:DNA-binding response regulator [Phycisphaerales bacterium]